MARDVYVRDTAGIAAILVSPEVRALVDTVAQEIASNLTLPSGVPVVVDSYTTDRAAASVTITDVRGKIYQARDGVLTRAASAAGVEVKEL